MSVPPFHRLLSYYSNRSEQPDTQTIRLQDSITGNLALGLDFPVAVGVAIARHLYLKNTGFFSLNIHVPSVQTRSTWLEDLRLDDVDRVQREQGSAGARSGKYTCGEIVSAARSLGFASAVDAVGLWALASDVHTGLLSADDVEKFRKGTLFETLERRRKGREQVLPLWRGGPLS